MLGCVVGLFIVGVSKKGKRKEDFYGVSFFK
jgi:hypothetical protein